MLREIFICLFCLGGGSYAQDDPQDIADIACAYEEAIYEFNTDNGTIESPGYPGEYEDQVECQWYINPTNGIPDGQNLFVEVVSFDTEYTYDTISGYVGEGTSGELLFKMDGQMAQGMSFSMGDQPVTLFFNCDARHTGTGFKLMYYFGVESPTQELAEIACTMPVVVTNASTTLLETVRFPASHLQNTFCEYIIVPDNVPEGLYMDVIYYLTNNYLYIFFDDNSDGQWDTYITGSGCSGYNLYVPGSALTLYYYGYWSDPGFQLVYYPADPACTSGSGSEIQVEGEGELKSPGYPYNVPEHLSCRWLLTVADNQKILLNSLDQDLYGDGFDCTDEYVEILDGGSEDAISLGKFCGNISFGTIASLGSILQVYLRSHEESTTESHSGFVFNYEPIDTI